jgi:hypothetical protein
MMPCMRCERSEIAWNSAPRPNTSLLLVHLCLPPQSVQVCPRHISRATLPGGLSSINLDDSIPYGIEGKSGDRV